MKITQIKIKDFHQFKDFTIDLTYPKGHAKEGQPLDKVCFIGQSGTGKTTLLELIPKFLYEYDMPTILKYEDYIYRDVIEMKIVFGISNEFESRIDFSPFASNIPHSVNWRWNDLRHCNRDAGIDFVYHYYKENWLKKESSQLIYFPSYLNYDIEVGIDDKLAGNKIIDFSKEKVSAIWNLILDKIQKYQERELQFKQEISNTALESSYDLEKIEISVNKYREWKKSQFNPIEDIANKCLNELLAPFKLRVKTEVKIDKKDDFGFIKIEDFAGNEIPHGLWSTGTKQVVLSAMPLYLLKPKHTVILFDEPERSLYPDMQRRIVDYYTSLTDNCQFFYATHSPIIASSFEPWEIVELKFNKEGYVYREQYYEGENHVDNYKWNPKYMRWDDILIRIFDMENDGSEDRRKKLDELATQNVKYNKLKKQGKDDSEEAKSILEKIIVLRKELSKWD